MTNRPRHMSPIRVRRDTSPPTSQRYDRRARTARTTMVSPRRRRHLQTRGGATPSISTSDVLAEATRRGIRTTPGKITMVSNDGRAFVVDQAVAYRFETLRGMEADDTELVPISGANGHTRQGARLRHLAIAHRSRARPLTRPLSTT